MPTRYSEALPRGERRTEVEIDGMELLQERRKARDLQQERLFKLLADPNEPVRGVLSAWLEVQIAQGDLDQLIKTKIQALLRI